MSLNIERDSKFIKVLAEQVEGKKVDPAQADEVQAIIAELAKDDSPENRHKLAQVIEFTINKIHPGTLDFLGNLIDYKTMNWGEQAVFNMRTEGIHIVTQAKGTSPIRSYVATKRILMPMTEEIAARPAINWIDLRSGRINMADLIAEVNRKITLQKLVSIQNTFIAHMQTFSAPFYGTGTGVVKATIDNMLAYFNRLSPVTILGDRAAIQKLATLSGFWGANGTQYVSDNMADEMNEYGFIGKYLGNNCICMPNDYRDQETNPVLRTDVLYIIPSNPNQDARMTKAVTEGGVTVKEHDSFETNDLELIVREQFGTCIISGGRNPNVGMYEIL